MSYGGSDGLIKRRTKPSPGTIEESNDEAAKSVDDEYADDHDSKETRLTLMEEVLLLGLKDREVLQRFTLRV